VQLVLVGKSYVGKTTNFSLRKYNHEKCSFVLNKEYNLAFHCAIRKYGTEHITWKILEMNIPLELLSTKECEWIDIIKSYKNGYNETLGGDGAGVGESNHNYGKKFSAETRAKLSKARKGKPASTALRAAVSQSNKIRVRRKMSEESKLKISLSKKGKKLNLSKEERSRRSTAIQGQNNPSLRK
jgi:group I intron endonuclease